MRDNAIAEHRLTAEEWGRTRREESPSSSNEDGTVLTPSMLNEMATAFMFVVFKEKLSSLIPITYKS